VLSNGENIEPLPIEDSIANIDLIDQVMLIGDERKSCVAVVVLNLDALVERGLMKSAEAKVSEQTNLRASEAERSEGGRTITSLRFRKKIKKNKNPQAFASLLSLKILTQFNIALFHSLLFASLALIFLFGAAPYATSRADE